MEVVDPSPMVAAYFLVVPNDDGKLVMLAADSAGALLKVGAEAETGVEV